jgi:formate hydrogenlyase subunit 3/multisubunit Na+/H+ antiporter MnhD subunit
VLGWIARGLLIVAGFVASWFVAKDAPQFGLVQMAVGLLLLILVVSVLAFWPERWTHILSRVHKPR